MNDDYHHINSELIYILDNIPGPSTEDIESKKIIESFDSQLISHCTCHDTCTIDTCSCIQNSGGTNYIKNEFNSVLNIEKAEKMQTYPFFECNISCNCKFDCGNRIVQYGPRQGLVIKSCVVSSKGYGLFSTEVIPQGSFICTYSGEVITRKEAMSRDKKNQLSNTMNYIFCLMEHSDGKTVETIVDPTMFGNIGRYINHSCEPNCLIIPVRVDSPIPKLAIFACSDIELSNEITFDYGPHSLVSTDCNRKKCLCGSELCREWLPFNVY